MADEPIEYRFVLQPEEDEALAHYVLYFEGIARRWNEDRGKEETIAEIRGRRIDLASANHDGVDQAELLDSLTPEIADFSATVLQDTNCLLPASAEEDLSAEACDGILYIQELRVAPEARGAGAGSELLKRIGGMMDLSQCIIALKAFPLQDELGRAATSDEVARIKRFYQRNGFTHANGQFMVKDARLCDVMKKRLTARRRSAAGSGI